jgi:HPt (histidine-containing phosphotransfer) domain-containing protein
MLADESLAVVSTCTRGSTARSGEIMTADITRADMAHLEQQPPTLDNRTLDHPVLDQTVLEQLRIDLEDEDGTAVAGLMSIYLDSAQTLIPDLTDALRSGDTTSAARFAHALASPSALIGAAPLGALLQRVQDDVQDATVPPADLIALAATIGRESDRVLAALAALVPQASAEPVSAG